MRAQPVAIGHANHELVVDVRPVRRFDRQHDFAEAGVGEQRAIARGVGAAAVAPAGELRQLDAQHRRLHRVDAEVGADQVVVVLRLHAVRADQPQLLRRARRRWP